MGGAHNHSTLGKSCLSRAKHDDLIDQWLHQVKPLYHPDKLNVASPGRPTTTRVSSPHALESTANKYTVVKFRVEGPRITSDRKEVDQCSSVTSQ